MIFPSRTKPQFSYMRACRKYWFTAVSSLVSTAFSSRMIALSPCMSEILLPAWLRETSRPRPAVSKTMIVMGGLRPGVGYSAANRSACRSSSSIRRMSQTHRAHCTWLSQARKISTGRLAPASIAARTWRSRIPLQLQTYMAREELPG